MSLASTGDGIRDLLADPVTIDRFDDDRTQGSPPHAGLRSGFHLPYNNRLGRRNQSGKRLTMICRALGYKNSNPGIIALTETPGAGNEARAGARRKVIDGAGGCVGEFRSPAPIV